MMRPVSGLVMMAPLAACVAAAPEAPVAPRADVAAVMQPDASGGVRVSRTAAPAYAKWDGAPARRDADALCGGRGVQSSIYDRYEAGTWVFVEGCA